jgi:YesN/AraC family two-component response regulator
MHSTRPRVDLVVIDVVMPGMDGVELANTLWEQWPDIRILFTSGHAAEVLAQHGLAYLDVPFLAKPYTRDEALAKVREALERRQEAGEESVIERRRKPPPRE